MYGNKRVMIAATQSYIHLKN